MCMKVGDKILGIQEYTVIGKIGPDRENANIYVCCDKDGQKFIAKHFYKQKPMPTIGYGKKNHFGRRRDGSRRVFKEIQLKSQQYGFLIDHIERIKHRGKWVIIVEYVNGITVNRFIDNHQSNISKIHLLVIALAETLSEWHQNGFAHGDPHVDNAIVYIEKDGNLLVKLIDYCQLHHKDFHYCKKYACFNPDAELRLNEDLINNETHFGRGFKSKILDLEKEMNLGVELSTLFNKHYNRLNQ